MEESTTLNIVYLPDEATRNKAIELSQKVSSQLPTEFTLGGDKHPHITIYQACFPNKNIEKLKEAVGEIAGKISSFGIEINGFTAVLSTFFWWNCIKTEILRNVHSELLAKANPLREGLIPANLQAFKGSEVEENEIKNYGSLLVGERYSPHITITRLKNPNDYKKASEILGQQSSNFIADKISLGYLGEHGTVTGIIEDFPLLS